MKRTLVLLLGLGIGAVAVAFGTRLSFQEHAAVQESLSRMHPRMRASWLRARGMDDSFYTTFHRPESTGLRCIGRWPWGPSWELAGRDTFLYLGSGSGVRILSIADSVQPRMLGQINARGLVSQVVVQDTLLFVACGSWGAQIYSVSNSANPRELGSMDVVIGDLCVKDTFCYTAGGDSLRIYNIANPARPVQVGTVRDSGGLVVEANGYAFVGYGGSGLNVYDVRDPHSPTRVNAVGGAQLALFVRGQLLFRTSVQPSYFQILDISDPTSVHEVGRIDGYGGHALYADDYFAYLSCAYDHEGIFVIDITNPANPQLRDSLNPFGTENYDSYVPAPLSYGYLASMEGGLVVVDMRDVDNLGLAWEGYVADQAIDIVVDGTRAYIADNQGGMPILDISNPALPTTLGQFDTLTPKYTSTVAARDSFAFVSMSGIPRRQFLRVLDVLDPSNPTVVAQESCYNPPEDYVLRDSLLCAAEDYRFQVFNVARPREPVLVGSCNLPGYSGKMDMRDSLAYVTNTVFSIVNTSDPASPTVVGNYGARMQGVDVVDTVLYGAAPYTGLLALSVADPTHPYALDSLPLTDTIWWTDVVVVGSRAYVGGERVWIVDASDPNDLRLVSGASWTPPYLIERLEYRAPYIYAGCLEAGVCILESTAVGVTDASREQPEAEQFLRVEPNPMRGSVRVIGMAPAGRVRVFDAAGRDVTERVSFVRSSDALSMEGKRLPGGIYFVKSENKKTSNVAKLIKP